MTMIPNRSLSSVEPGKPGAVQGGGVDITPPGAGAAGAPVDARVWKAAQDFETMAINQMLEPMFSTIDTSQDFFGGGAGEQNFRPMLVTEMAKAVEQRGGLGLATPVYEQMLKMQEKRR